jgi:hypothetical protein
MLIISDDSGRDSGAFNSTLWWLWERNSLNQPSDKPKERSGVMQLAGIQQHRDAISMLMISVDHVFDYNVLYSCIHWDGVVSRFRLVRVYGKKNVVEVMYEDEDHITTMVPFYLAEEMREWIKKNQMEETPT